MNETLAHQKGTVENETKSQVPWNLIFFRCLVRKRPFVDPRAFYDVEMITRSLYFFNCMTYMTRAVGYTSTLGGLHGPVCIRQEERLTTLHFGFDLG